MQDGAGSSPSVCVWGGGGGLHATGHTHVPQKRALNNSLIKYGLSFFTPSGENVGVCALAAARVINGQSLHCFMFVSLDIAYMSREKVSGVWDSCISP
jgi:hypothetical protein